MGKRVENKFWLVWSPNVDLECVKYYRKKPAIRVAEYLAEESPGYQFFVMESTHGATVKEQQVTSIKLTKSDNPDGLPF